MTPQEGVANVASALAAGGPNSSSAAELLCDGTPPYQTKMGNPVPPSGLPLLYPGSNLPAKVRPGQEGQCIIDWEAAVADATRGVAG